MTWNEFLIELISQKKEGASKADIFTREKRAAEDSIVLRLNLLFGSNWETVEAAKKAQKKSGSNDFVYDRPRIKQIFWQFVENALQKASSVKKQQKQLHDFLYKLIDNNFASDEERNQYIKTFYQTFCKKEGCPDDYYMSDKYSIVPPQFKARVKDIIELKSQDDIADLFASFEICIRTFAYDTPTQFDRDRIFENSSDEERKLYKLLYLEFPKYLQNANDPQNKKINVLDSMEKGLWENFDVSLRLKLIECIDALWKKEKTIYDFFRTQDTDDIDEFIESMKYAINRPVQSRLAHDISFIIQMYHYGDKSVDAFFERDTVADFQKKLRNLIKSHFLTNDYSEGVILDTLCAHSDKLKPYEEQLTEVLNEREKETTEEK